MSAGLSARQPVWDLPIRLVHWVLAALIAFSWWSAEYNHTDWHIWSGIMILTLLVFRLLWGFFGSSTARFASFVPGPAQLMRYLRGDWTGMGHTPLGALSVLALFAVVAVQVGLGLFNEDEDGLYAGPLAALVSTDTSDRVRGLHATWFYVVLGVIALHIAAILFYRVARGEKADQTDDYRQGDARPRSGADAAGQMVGRLDLPCRRFRVQQVDRGGRPAFWFLIATGLGATSQPC